MGVRELQARTMVCDSFFPWMRCFQMGQIWASIRNQKSCCRARCNALKQHQDLLLTQAFNKRQMKQLKWKRLRGKEELCVPACSRDITGFLSSISLLWDKNTQCAGSFLMLCAAKLSAFLGQGIGRFRCCFPSHFPLIPTH